VSSRILILSLVAPSSKTLQLKFLEVCARLAHLASTVLTAQCVKPVITVVPAIKVSTALASASAWQDTKDHLVNTQMLSLATTMEMSATLVPVSAILVGRH